MVYFCFIIPFIAAVILLVFYKKHVVWWELAVPIAASTIFILVAKAICIHSLTTDEEYLGGYITQVRYYEDWNEYIHRTCAYKCGKSTCYRDCSYVKYHPEYWEAISTVGTFNISEQKYKKLLNQFGATPVFRELHRNSYTNDGDMYSGDWKNDNATLEPAVVSHNYENRPKAAVNVYHFDKPDSADVRQYKLFEYPPIYDVYKQDALLGYNDPKAARMLQILNSRLGAPKQLRVFILVFKDQPREAAIMQENYWEGGNKNEFVICIGIDAQQRVKWSHDFSWTEREDSKVETRTFIENQGILDLPAIVDFTYTELNEKYERKNFADFNYLNIEPTLKQVVWIFIFTIIVNIGVAVWVVKNEIEE